MCERVGEIPPRGPYAIEGIANEPKYDHDVLLLCGGAAVTISPFLPVMGDLLCQLRCPRLLANRLAARTTGPNASPSEMCTLALFVLQDKSP